MTQDARPDPFRDIRPDVAAQREAYLATVEPHRPELFRFARGLTGSPWDAEDLVQETLMRAFCGLGTHSGRVANLRAYLFRVAANAWIDQQRRRRPALAEPAALERAGEDAPLGPEVREALERVVLGLPPRERAAVLLKEVFGFSLKEIAAALRATVGAVKAALHRGRTKLAALAEPEPDPPAAVPAALDAWVDAFNRHDVDGMLALMVEDCRVAIPGILDDDDDAMGQSVLAATVGEKTLLHAERACVAGEAVVVVRYRVDGDDDDAAGAIGDVFRVETTGDRITGLVSYYYSPDVLEEVAAALGARPRTQGYRM